MFTSPTNYIQSQTTDLYTAHLNKPKDAANRWTADNPITNGYPRLIDSYGTAILSILDTVTFSPITDGATYDDASYWKLGSVSLLYNLPQEMVKRWGLSNMGVSFTATNLLTVTGFKGLNPESPGAVYPISRSFSLGLNIGL